MTVELPDPGPGSDVRELFLTYLDFYRETIAAKLSGLSDADLRTSRLPSGWSPIELLKHVVHMERRWLVWGVLGEQVDRPWGDQREDRWYVAADESLDDLLAALRRGGARTREIVESLPLAATAADTGRFGGRPAPPSVTAVLFHVLQEYARHAGHLDIVRELIDGRTGE
jgi:uncharacterized damage-inducible protein DinB